jgi:hypothetical protein
MMKKPVQSEPTGDFESLVGQRSGKDEGRMKKLSPDSADTVSQRAKAGGDDLAPLIAEVRELIGSARRAISSVVDTLQVRTNFEIGRRIVEHEQKGAKRAEYGAKLLKELSARLTEEFGRGFSRANLQLMRKFFIVWSERRTQICQTASGIFVQKGKSQTVSGELMEAPIPEALPEPSGQNLHTPFALNPTIGLLLCKEKKDAVVQLTLPKDANIHAKEYQLYLPSKELLKAKLLEWTREESVKDGG